jgi:hypothetical protein
MKTLVVCCVIIACCFPLSGHAQLRHDYYPDATLASQNFPGDTLPKPRKLYAREWFGGFKGALISTGGIVISTVLIMTTYSGTPSGVGFGIGIGCLLATVISQPFLVSYFAYKDGKKYFPEVRYWQPLTGALAVATLNYLVLLSSDPDWVILTTPITGLILMPVVAALTGRLFYKPGVRSAPGALVNIHNGHVEFGTPVPVVYPNPLMQNKICSQISLLRLSF